MAQANKRTNVQTGCRVHLSHPSHTRPSASLCERDRGVQTHRAQQHRRAEVVPLAHPNAPNVLQCSPGVSVQKRTARDSWPQQFWKHHPVVGHGSTMIVTLQNRSGISTAFRVSSGRAATHIVQCALHCCCCVPARGPCMRIAEGGRRAEGGTSPHPRCATNPWPGPTSAPIQAIDQGPRHGGGGSLRVLPNPNRPPPPPHPHNFTTKKMQLVKGARSWRPIGGTHTCCWSQNPPPPPPPPGGQSPAVWTGACLRALSVMQKKKKFLVMCAESGQHTHRHREGTRGTTRGELLESSGNTSEVCH